jgi:dihydropteroate synthase
VIVTPLAVHSPRAIRELLRSAGWDELRAEAAAAGLGPSAFRIGGLTQPVIESLVHHAGKLGLEILTGDDWAIIAGSHSRLGALARPWLLPPELSELGQALGQALPPDPAPAWVTARGSVSLDGPVIVGILNVTPDSFSDGGQFTGLDAALSQADRLLAEGAAVVDVGGESTRPGQTPVPPEEEIRRVVPVLEALVSRHPKALFSVDTVKASVAEAALGAGAAVINDVSAFRLDPAMAKVAVRTGCGVVLMHSRGSVAQMATMEYADYGDDVVGAVRSELHSALLTGLDAGLAPERIVLDPGLGFAKSPEQSLRVLDGLESLVALGRPVLVGPSRKRFLGAVTGLEVGARDGATAAACVVAYERGARLFRVHSVAATRDALMVAHAVRTR